MIGLILTYSEEDTSVEQAAAPPADPPLTCHQEKICTRSTNTDIMPLALDLGLAITQPRGLDVECFARLTSTHDSPPSVRCNNSLQSDDPPLKNEVDQHVIASRHTTVAISHDVSLAACREASCAAMRRLLSLQGALPDISPSDTGHQHSHSRPPADPDWKPAGEGVPDDSTARRLLAVHTPPPHTPPLQMCPPPPQPTPWLVHPLPPKHPPPKPAPLQPPPLQPSPPMDPCVRSEEHHV